MSEHLTDANPLNGATGPRTSSLLGKLNTTRDARLAQRTLDVPIAAWQGSEGYGLTLTLRALPFADMQPLNRKLVRGLMDDDDDPEVELRIACDALIRACVDLRVSTPEGELVALDDADAAEPCRFDQRTCQLLGLPEPRSAREAVLLIFRRNEWQVMEAWGELQEFTRRGQRDETESLLGET